MDWTHIASALFGATFALLLAYGVYRVALEKRYSLRAKPEEEPEEDPMDNQEEKNQMDRAFEVLDSQEGVGDSLANNIFPLAPRAGSPRAISVQPTTPKAEDRIILEAKGHPCRFLDLTTPPHFRAGECMGLCRHPSQNGRICHWAPAVAKQCSYFDPKVRPATKLRTSA